MGILTQAVLLKKKQELIVNRNKKEGITTTFSLVEKAALNTGFKDETLYAPQTTAFNATNLLHDEQHLIIQHNHTNQDTVPYARLTEVAQTNIEQDNMKLRMLDMTRTLDLMLEQRALQFSDHAAKYNQKREALFSVFERLTYDHIKTEKDYEYELIKIIKSVGLDHGLDPNNPKAYAQLLEYYRIMASLLDPATVLESRYTEGADQDEMTHQEVSVPVTTKTDEQRAALKVMQQLALNPAKNNTNAHSGLTAAFQEVNTVFSHLIQLDNRMLGAQARQYIAEGAKNAYIVRYAIQKQGKIYVLINGRAGSPAYVGPDKEKIYKSTKDKFVSEVEIQTHTQENLQQMQASAQMLTGSNEIGIVHLVSNVSNNHEKHMVTHTRDAAANGNHIYYNNIPVNGFGAVLSNQIAPEYNTGSDLYATRVLSVFSKTDRYELAVRIAGSKSDVVCFYICASGQDRTGTAVKESQLEFAVACGMTREQAEHIHACMANGAHITELRGPGSPGIKLESEGGLFGEELTETLYRRSADSNKTPPIHELPEFVLVCQREIGTDICHAYLVKTEAIVVEDISSMPDKNINNVMYVVDQFTQALTPRGNQDRQIEDIAPLCLNDGEAILQVHEQLLKTHKNARGIGLVSQSLLGRFREVTSEDGSANAKGMVKDNRVKNLVNKGQPSCGCSLKIECWGNTQKEKSVSANISNVPLLALNK